MPTISVVVPVYKVENYIHRCVDSILNQTYRDFELILVDDGSPDSCGTICDEYAAKDDRVVVIHQENGGLSAARNAGIDWAFANSDSQWLTFVDSDDFLYHEYLQRMFQAVTECDTLISTCNATQTVFSDNEEDYLPQKNATEDAYCNSVVLYHRIPAWGKLYHKSLWQNIRYPVGRLHEDRFTTHKILFQVPEIATILAPMYWVTPNPNSITHVKWTSKRLDHVDAVEEELAFFVQNGFRKAELRTVKSAVYLIAQSIDEVAASDEPESSKKQYISNLSAKLRKLLTQYRQHLPVREYANVYEIVYPTKMRLYWFFDTVKRKLKLRRAV